MDPQGGPTVLPLETVVLPMGPVASPGGPGEVLDADSMQRSTVGLEDQTMGDPSSSKVESTSSLGQTVRDRMRSRLKKKQVSF